MGYTDARFLEHYTAPYIPALADEMTQLGEFLLLIAQERAEQAGVEADYTARRGELEPTLIEAAKEYGASLIILGRPGVKNVTTLEYLEIAGMDKQATYATERLDHLDFSLIGTWCWLVGISLEGRSWMTKRT